MDSAFLFQFPKEFSITDNFLLVVISQRAFFDKRLYLYGLGWVFQRIV